MTDLRASYPHLTAVDAALWNDYLILNPDLDGPFMYDVPVGDPRDPGPEFADNIRQMAKQLSLRRLDVVADNGSDIAIYEITQSCGLRAIGQAMVYPALLTTTWKTQVPISVTIICREIQSNIQTTLDSQHIQAIVVPVLQLP